MQWLGYENYIIFFPNYFLCGFPKKSLVENKGNMLFRNTIL
jgi:hypothetical protein